MKNSSPGSKQPLEQLAQQVAEYEDAYWQRIFALIARTGSWVLPAHVEMIRAVKVFECLDGVIVLRFPNPGRPFQVTRERPGKTVEKSLSNIWLHDPFRNRFPEPCALDFQGQGGLQLLSPVVGALATYYTSDFLSAAIYRLPVAFPDPAKHAESNIRFFLLASHLGQIKRDPAEPEARGRVLARLDALYASFIFALENSKNEGDMQGFLEANPFLISATGEVTPQVQLGTDYRPDFVVEDLLASGHTHVFVEIESPNKFLFTKGTQQSHQLTQAIHQTEQWRKWLRTEAQHFKRKFPRFNVPAFLVIIGRRSDLSPEQEEMLIEFNARTPDTEVLTYDDLGERLRRIRESLSGLE